MSHSTNDKPGVELLRATNPWGAHSYKSYLHSGDKRELDTPCSTYNIPMFVVPTRSDAPAVNSRSSICG